ncbi:hypothetical protein BLA29_002975 [Euroglyphus maynei]|uniref:Uncharacterized protein n=1 Tax=Euroglyphus maynei TaxID=6958 RepID=A0A1Y3BR51_EURMA|nr:hypothetical protein BLA29_002975 [Euroglyphus maynei]
MNQSSWLNDHHYDNDGDQSTNRDNIHFFDQINAKNHRPFSTFISPAESQSRVAIASPDDDNDYNHIYNSKHSNRLHSQSTNPNVYYYSPKNYGKTSNHSSSMIITSTPGSTIETQQTASHQPVMTSMDKSSKIRFELNDPSSSTSSSSSPGKTLLIHKFYNHDLSQMTAALNKHTGNNWFTIICNNQSSSSSPRLLRRYYTTGKSQSSSIPVTASLRHMQTSHSHPMPHYYLPSSVHSHGMYDTSLLGGHHGTKHHHISLPEKSGTWLGSGLAAGILIGAIPFGIMMASMMPTLFTGAMPIVNTAAVGKRRRRRSILDDWATTIVGQQQSKNSKRSVSLLDQTTMDKLGVFIRRGIIDVIGLLNEYQDNYGHDMAKNNHRVPFDRNNVFQQQQQQQQPQQEQPQPKPSYLYSDGNVNDIDRNMFIKTVAKYALAALDEPKCIKEMFCSLMADGRHARTTPWQKTLYLLIKW